MTILVTGCAGFIGSHYSLAVLKNNKKVLIAGYTFKENCPDIRNSKVCNITTELQKFGFECEIYDPIAYFDAEAENKLKIIKEVTKHRYLGLILAVKHKIFIELGHSYWNSTIIENGLFFDIKSAFHKDHTNYRL